MAERQFAYTGPTPDTGLVGYLNIQAANEGGHIRFIVRTAGSDPVTAFLDVPADEARRLLADAAIAL